MYGYKWIIPNNNGRQFSPHYIGQVLCGEMEFGLGTNMLSVVGGTILKIKQWTHLLE